MISSEKKPETETFLQRLWRNIVDEETGDLALLDRPADIETQRLLHRTIAGVRDDMEALRFNTAIAKLIELNNHLTKLGGCPVDVAEPMVLMVSPLAAHLAEELWAKLGHSESLAFQPFPTADPSLLVADTVEYPVQVNGKVRGHITVGVHLEASGVEAAALADPKVVAFLAGATPKKLIVVPGRMVNIVV